MKASTLASLEHRLARIKAASYHTLGSELGGLWAFIQRTGMLHAMSESIRNSAPEFDPEEWTKTVLAGGPISFPEEPSYTKLLQHLVKGFATDIDYLQFGHKLFLRGDYNDTKARVVEVLVTPYVLYLEERVGTETELLHILGRYRQRVEWFTREGLYSQYENDTARGEAVYDTDLRMFLFGEGIDYPFSTPASPSGRADAVTLLDTSDPLVCEVKLYNAASYGIPYVAKGFKQAHRYAGDYGKFTAHLVVFNLTDETLQLPNDNPGDAGPPSLSVAGIRTYIHIIQAKPLATASEPGKLKTRIVERAQIVSALEETPDET